MEILLRETTGLLDPLGADGTNYDLLNVNKQPKLDFRNLKNKNKLL